MCAWAGGGSGPDFFVALAHHPEWGTGHTVWGDVIGGDMRVSMLANYAADGTIAKSPHYLVQHFPPRHLVRSST